MKKISAFWLAVVLFGAINIFEGISSYGVQAVDLPRLQLHLFWLWVFVRNTVAYTLVPASLVFLFGKRSRIVLTAFFVYAIVAIGACIYSLKVFRAPLPDIWLALVMNSSPYIMLNFAKMMLTAKMCVLLLLILGAISGIAILFWRARYPKVCWRSFIIGLAMVSVFLVTNCLTMNWHFGLGQVRYTELPIGGYGWWLRQRGVIDACDKPDLPTKLSVAVAEKDMPNGVFIMGESATRKNWHLYGYKRRTTPAIDALADNNEIVYFDDVVGAHPETVGAHSLVMSDVNFDDESVGHWTLAEAFRRAGYRCVQIAAPFVWGGDKSILNKLYKGCETRHIVGALHSDRKVYDGDLIPYLEKELQNDTRPTIFFLWFSGMHYPLRDANPKEDDYFTNEIDPEALEGLSDFDKDRRNRYDNGILYEDKVLGQIIDVLKNRSHRPTFLFFSSDHGESPRSPQWRNFKDQETYELPVFFWFSCDYKEAHRPLVEAIASARSKPLQPDELTIGLLSLGFVTGVPNVGPRDVFFDADFRGRQPRKIDRGREVYVPTSARGQAESLDRK